MAHVIMEPQSIASFNVLFIKNSLADISNMSQDALGVTGIWDHNA